MWVFFPIVWVGFRSHVHAGFLFGPNFLGWVPKKNKKNLFDDLDKRTIPNPSHQSNLLLTIYKKINNNTINASCIRLQTNRKEEKDINHGYFILKFL